MLSLLHIEMVMLSWNGDLLEDSGWTIALSNARTTSPKYMHGSYISLWYVPTPNILNKILPTVDQVLKSGEQVCSRETYNFNFNP